MVYYPLEQTFSLFKFFEFVFLLHGCRGQVLETHFKCKSPLLRISVFFNGYKFKLHVCKLPVSDSQMLDTPVCANKLWLIRNFINAKHRLPELAFTGLFLCRWSFSALREGLVFTEVSLTGSQPEGRFSLFMSRSLHLPMTPPVRVTALLFISFNNTIIISVIICLNSLLSLMCLCSSLLCFYVSNSRTVIMFF